MEILSDIWPKIVELSAQYLPRLALALSTLVIGWSLVNFIVKKCRGIMEKKEVDISLIPFLSTLISVLLRVMLVISVASMVGIETTSFLAALGAAGLAIGLALQGSLSNLAGGVLILILRPFRVGDVIEAQGFLGIVKEIQIFYTIVMTFDNRRIYIPNGAMANGNIMNITAEQTRRVDMEFGVSYSDDIIKVRDILTEMINADERVMKEPAEPFIKMTKMADSSLNFTVRAWCKAEDYWNIYFEMLEKVKLRFDQEGITIPFPQRDVHVYEHAMPTEQKSSLSNGTAAKITH